MIEFLLNIILCCPKIKMNDIAKSSVDNLGMIKLDSPYRKLLDPKMTCLLDFPMKFYF
jgi:hypothetical protein